MATVRHSYAQCYLLGYAEMAERTDGALDLQRHSSVLVLDADLCVLAVAGYANATRRRDASGLAPSPTRSCPFFKKRAVWLVYMLR